MYNYTRTCNFLCSCYIIKLILIFYIYINTLINLAAKNTCFLATAYIDVKGLNKISAFG